MLPEKPLPKSVAIVFKLFCRTLLQYCTELLYKDPVRSESTLTYLKLGSHNIYLAVVVLVQETQKTFSFQVTPPPPYLSLVPRPCPAFRRLQYEKAGRAWYLFSREHDIIGKLQKIA